MLQELNIPILSVLIVTYQSADEILDCLASIPKTLTPGRVEVIVVDNASTDATTELVGKNFPDVTLYLSKENLGFSRANNVAFRKSSGRVILYLNPDTIVNSVALEACLARVLNEPKTGMISPRLVQADGSLDLACRRSIPSVWDGFTRATGLAKIFSNCAFFAGYNLTYLPEVETYPVGAVNGAFMMMRRTVLNEIGLLDERFFMYGEDLDLCYRCHLAGYQVIYDGRHTVIHLKGQSSSKNHRAAARQIFTSTELFYQKHFNAKNSILVRWKYHFLFLLWEILASIIALVIGHKKARPV